MSQPDLIDTTRPGVSSVGTWVGGESTLHAAEGACEVSFEGVLHNADELRKELALVKPASSADVVLRGYLRWGPDVVPRLRGAFALLVRDHRGDSVLCARDPIGIHPLFYAHADGQLLVSPSIQALVDTPGVSSAVNREALADHLSHRWPDRGETYYEAVRRVPPGHALHASRSGKRIYRYWEPVPDGEDVEWISEAEVDERFEALLDQALDRCVAGEQAGVWLSGGLDSVTVAGVAADRCRTHGWPDPIALSLIFPHPDANEETVQRGVAEGLGLPHVLMGFFEAIGDEGMLPAALDASRTWPAPLLSFWLPAYGRLGLEGRRRGCTTILTGGGGDEWLTVTPTYAANLMRGLDLKGLYRLGRAQRRSFYVSRRGVAKNLLWRFGTRPLLAAGATAALERVAPWALRSRVRRRFQRESPAWIAPDPALRQAIERRAERAWPKPRFGDFYMRELRETLDHPLVAVEMEEVFENGRRAGVRILQPFLDADLVDFLYRVPPELLNRGGRAKGLVRDTVSRRFPELGFERQKKVAAAGFSRPLLAAEGARVWKDLGGATALVEAGIVDRDGVERCIQEALASTAQGLYAYRLWDTVSLEAWLRPRL